MPFSSSRVPTLISIVTSPFSLLKDSFSIKSGMRWALWLIDWLIHSFIHQVHRGTFPFQKGRWASSYFVVMWLLWSWLRSCERVRWIHITWHKWSHDHHLTKWLCNDYIIKHKNTNVMGTVAATHPSQSKVTFPFMEQGPNIPTVSEKAVG